MWLRTPNIQFHYLLKEKKILIELNFIPFVVRQKRLCCWAAIKLVHKMPHNVPCTISEVISEHLGAKQNAFLQPVIRNFELMTTATTQINYMIGGLRN